MKTMARSLLESLTDDYAFNNNLRFCKEIYQKSGYGGVIVPSDILWSRSGDTSRNMSATLHYVHVRN